MSWPHLLRAALTMTALLILTACQACSSGSASSGGGTSAGAENDGAAQDPNVSSEGDGSASDGSGGTDTGSTWTAAGYAAGGLFTSVAVDPVDPDTVYLGSDVSGIYKSTDSGESWRPQSTGLASLAIAGLLIDPANRERLWVATPLGLYRSDDGAATWTLIDDGINSFILTTFPSMAVSPDGMTILATSHRLAPNENFLNQYRQADLTGSLYRSSNGGESWKVITDFPQTYPSGTRFTVIAFDPYTPGQAYLAVSGFGILRSTDGGLTWSSFTPDAFPDDLADSDWRSLDIGPTTIFAAATSRSAAQQVTARFYKSDKTAPNWSKINSGLPQRDSASVSQTVELIRVSPSDESNVFLGYAGWPALFYASTDGGGSWSPTPVEKGTTYTFDQTVAPFQATMDPFNDYISLAIDPSDDQRMFATTWLGVWRTEDGGNTWQEKVRGTQNTVCTDLVYSGDTLFSAHMDTILQSSTGPADAWESSLPQPGGPTGLAHAWDLEHGADGKLFVSVSVEDGPPRVYRSDDNGKNWVDVSPEFVPSGDPATDNFAEVHLATDLVNPGTVFALNTTPGNGVFKSTNHGAMWAKLGSQPASDFAGEIGLGGCITVDPDDPERIYVGTFASGLWISRTGGADWSIVEGSDGSQVSDIVALAGGTVWAAVYDGIFRSLDSGDTFDSVPMGDNLNFAEFEIFTTIIVNPDDPNEVFVASAKEFPVYHNAGSVWRSTNAGQSWTEIGSDLTFKRVTALAYRDGYIYAGIDGADVYRRQVP